MSDPSPPSLDEVIASRWYLGSMNDGLFIIDKPPRPSTDDIVYDRKDGPSLVLNVTDLPLAKAAAIVEAHNAALAHLEASRWRPIAEADPERTYHLFGRLTGGTPCYAYTRPVDCDYATHFCECCLPSLPATTSEGEEG